LREAGERFGKVMGQNAARAFGMERECARLTDGLL